MSELPDGWASTTLGELLPVSYGKALEQQARSADGTYRYVGSGGPIASTDERLTFGETIVIGRKGTAGSVQRFPQGCWPSDTTFYVEVPKQVSGQLVEHQLRFAQLAQHDRSTALPGLGRPDLESTVLAIPPRREQERIVTAIEEAFSKLDAGEAGLRTVRQLLKRMRDAILTAAVTGRLVPQDPTDTPAPKLLADLGVEPHAADVPTGWALTTVGSVFRVAVGTTPRRDDPSMWGGEVWWVSSGEVAFNRIRSTRETITSKAVLRDGRVLPAGTVLLAMIGEGKTRGQPAILDVPAAHNQNCASIRVEGTGVSSEWVYTFLASRYSETRRAGSGNNQPALNKRLIEAIEIPIPPPEEQARIVAEVERQMSFLDACERAVDVGLARAAGLRRSVLKAAFEGRLVPQDPSDEPASVLLERIRAERAAAPGQQGKRRKKAEAS